MRSNKREGTRPCHIVPAWIREGRYCLRQKAVEEKSNEITAIPKVPETIEIKGRVETIDAMGTQTYVSLAPAQFIEGLMKIKNPQSRIWVRADIHVFVVIEINFPLANVVPMW